MVSKFYSYGRKRKVVGFQSLDLYQYLNITPFIPFFDQIKNEQLQNTMKIKTISTQVYVKNTYDCLAGNTARSLLLHNHYVIHGKSVKTQAPWTFGIKNGNLF